MKRGFLNSSKAKQRTAAAVDSETANNLSVNEGDSSSGQEQKGAVDPGEQLAMAVDPKKLDPHKVPPGMLDDSCNREGRTRIIFRFWPRDPNGKPLQRSELRGKEAGNGIDLWGATLYDFFVVHRFPTIEGMITRSTGSKLAAAMRRFGELEAAASEIAWADEEEDPRVLHPCDIGELLECSNVRIAMGIWDSMGLVKKQKSPKAVVEPFDFDNYPDPWPLVPFSGGEWPTLSKSIPFHLLPQKLVVHDPWNLLSVNREYRHSDIDTPWMEKEDITRIYNLFLSDDGIKKAEERLEPGNEKREGVSILPFVETSGPMNDPPVIAITPRQPPPPESTPIAHVYISPTELLGIGHHSVVYKVEWELPRSLLVEPKLCQTCVLDMTRDMMATLKKEDVARDMDSAGASTDSDSIQGNITVTDFDDPGRHMECITPDEWKALSALQMKKRSEDSESGNSDSNENNQVKLSSGTFYTIRDPSTTRIISYEGPVLTYHPDVEWQVAGHPAVCDHHFSRSRYPVPPTAKVQVAVKLSLEGDSHLETEAENYQKFPSHFFEHWNGYNVVPPLHDPVPVNALVPQFYGYYIPETVEEDIYLSPIMLLEHCGMPVEPEGMSVDNRNECASLLFRFHHGGWLHESFAPRNILSQPGHPTQWPIERNSSGKHSFRLIDFGRSRIIESPSERGAEEGSGCDLFSVPQ